MKPSHQDPTPTLIKAASHGSYIFFGTSSLSVTVLKEMISAGYPPSAIVTTPDKPKGRKLVLTAPETKAFAIENNIPCLQFEKLNDRAVTDLKKLHELLPNISFYLVASYGLIIPKTVLDIPRLGVLNIHPSLLPAYRGASPIQNAILDDKADTGITIMKMDEKMDHGPVIIQEKRVNPSDWPKRYIALENELAIQATHALVEILPSFLKQDESGQNISSTEQDHGNATFTKKFSKSDGEININELTGDAGRKQFLKFCAIEVWPTTFFNIKKQDENTRVKITDAIWDDMEKKMIIKKVIPEGQKEVAYSDFLERVKLYY